MKKKNNMRLQVVAGCVDKQLKCYGDTTREEEAECAGGRENAKNEKKSRHG